MDSIAFVEDTRAYTECPAAQVAEHSAAKLLGLCTLAAAAARRLEESPSSQLHRGVLDIATRGLRYAMTGTWVRASAFDDMFGDLRFHAFDLLRPSVSAMLDDLPRELGPVDSRRGPIAGLLERAARLSRESVDADAAIDSGWKLRWLGWDHLGHLSRRLDDPLLG